MGVLRVYGLRPVQRLANGYVSFFRGTPLVVQLFCWYFGLPQITLFVESFPSLMAVLGTLHLAWVPRLLVLSPMGSAILGFSLCSGAYHSEYVRGGLLSIRSGQIKAAQALGMTLADRAARVLPRRAPRPARCGNEIVTSSVSSQPPSSRQRTHRHGRASPSPPGATRGVLHEGVYYLLSWSPCHLILSRIKTGSPCPASNAAGSNPSPLHP